MFEVKRLDFPVNLMWKLKVKNMRRFQLSLFLFFVSCICMYAQKVSLKFGDEGTFKIVQFTDLHFIYQDKRSDVVLECIRNVMEAEKPDLVMLTGDVIFGKPAEKSLRTVLDLISTYEVPFGITFGNHDDEQGLNKEELMKIIKTYPYNLTECEPGLSGSTNYILPLKQKDGVKDAAVLYCFDSHSYSQLKGIDGYDYIKSDQIAWYRKKSAEFTSENGGKPLPAYAFFHIPLPEYHAAVADENATLIGTRMEKACSPELNSGMFVAMKEAGDVKAVFVGHDHDNDYAVYWHDILLAYGRYTGGNTVYNHLSNGARIILLHQDGKSFETWIRLRGGEIINKTECPGDFIKE